MIPAEQKEAPKPSDHNVSFGGCDGLKRILIDQTDADPTISKEEEDFTTSDASQYVPTFKRATPAMLGQIPRRYQDLYLDAEDQILNMDYSIFSSKQRLARYSTNLVVMKDGLQKSRDLYNQAKTILYGSDDKLSAESAIAGSLDCVEMDLAMIDDAIKATKKEVEELAVLIKAEEVTIAAAKKELERICAELVREGNVKSCRAWSMFRLF